MMNLMGGLDKPSKGTVKIGGIDLSKMNENELAEVRQKIGFVFQFFNLIPRLNARESVELPMTIQSMNKDERRKKAEDLLKLVGLEDRIEHRPTELSGGERQRVAIARALASEPTFLLLDEPTGNIDSKTAKDLMKLIAELKEQNNMTMIMITHDSKIAKFSKRQIHLLDGIIVKEVTK